MNALQIWPPMHAVDAITLPLDGGGQGGGVRRTSGLRTLMDAGVFQSDLSPIAGLTPNPALPPSRGKGSSEASA